MAASRGRIPPLVDGDRLTRDEFEHRYDAMIRARRGPTWPKGSSASPLPSATSSTAVRILASSAASGPTEPVPISARGK